MVGPSVPLLPDFEMQSVVSASFIGYCHYKYFKDYEMFR